MAKKVMTLSPVSGSYDVHTPADARGYLLPSVHERIQQLHAQLEQLQERREGLHYALGRPASRNLKRFKNFEHQQKSYPPEVLKEFFTVGDHIAACNTELNTLNIHLLKTTDESFESMFVRAAKNLLLPEDFERVKKYTHLLMNELAETVCLPQDFIDG